MMKKKYTIIIMAIGIIGAIVGTYFEHKRIEKLHVEFSSVSIDTYFENKIEDVSIEKGAIFVTLKSKKIFLNVIDNKSYSFKYPQEILSIGDSIVKNKNSDTLYLFHDNKKYWFKLSFE
ncbi:MAG TPA: hypothetical protein PKN21_09705 [Bacteroidales bacterium]|nr:hypothetical protein [Bacteroidales bacterium]